MKAEVDSAEAQIEALDAELKLLLLPADPNAGRNVIVEIRGAEGGEEANLWAKDLFDMYTRYADRMKWKVEVLGIGPVAQGRHQRGRVLDEGRQRVDAHEVRRRTAPRAARAGYGEPGPHPHVGRHRDGVARGRRDRRADRREGSEGRRLPIDRSGRPVGQHHRLRGAHHAHSRRASSWPCRTRRARSKTAPKRCRCCGRACSKPSRTSRKPNSPTRGASRSAAAGAARRSARTTTRRTASPITASVSRCTSSTESSWANSKSSATRSCPTSARTNSPVST